MIQHMYSGGQCPQGMLLGDLSGSQDIRPSMVPAAGLWGSRATQTSFGESRDRVGSDHSLRLGANRMTEAENLLFFTL